jgi:hypothetical protein
MFELNQLDILSQSGDLRSHSALDKINISITEPILNTKQISA